MARISSRRTRRAENKRWRLTKPHWVDPYPFIPGTEPEKRLFEALVRRKIFFCFQADLPELSQENKNKITKQIRELETEIRHLIAKLARMGNRDPQTEKLIRQKIELERKLLIEKAKLDEIQKAGISGAFLFQPGFKPDFILPEYRVIIDPFGVFHHSLPEAVKRDAMKSVVYRALGYAFYHPWWDERGYLWADGTGTNLTYERIGYDANLLLDRMKEVRRGPIKVLTDPVLIAAKRFPGYYLGKNLGAGANSVAIANAMRAKPRVLTLKRRRRG